MNQNLTNPNPKPKRQTFENFNTDFYEYKKRSEGAKSCFAAGIFVSIAQKDSKKETGVLMVEDRQEANKVWRKIPGGVPSLDALVSKKSYLEELKTQLEKMKYSSKLLKGIMAKEEGIHRLLPERAMILEMIEETGYYPVVFGYLCDGYRYNRDSRQYDLWQVYFSVFSIVSPNSESLEHVIKEVAEVRTLEPLDKDVQEMRLVVPVKKAIAEVGPDTHKEVLKVFFANQEKYFRKKGFMTLAKFYAEALIGAE